MIASVERGESRGELREKATESAAFFENGRKETKPMSRDILLQELTEHQCQCVAKESA
jgi:hypothetical protein